MMMMMMMMMGGSLVTAAWHVLRLQMEVLQLWRVAVNILNKQSRTANKGWSSTLRVGHCQNLVFVCRSLAV
jgi:hypothetical protein